MINIALHLGNVALKIGANVKADKQSEVQGYGIASQAYRAGASKVFGPKGHDREEPFSEQLAADVEAGLRLVLGEYCDKISIEASPYIKSTKKQLTVEDVLASLSEEQLTAALEARKAKVEASEDSIG